MSDRVDLKAFNFFWVTVLSVLLLFCTEKKCYLSIVVRVQSYLIASPVDWKKKNLNKYLLALFHSREKDMVSNYFVFLSLECLGIGLDYTLYLDEVDPC